MGGGMFTGSVVSAKFCTVYRPPLTGVHVTPVLEPKETVWASAGGAQSVRVVQRAREYPGVCTADSPVRNAASAA